MDQYTIAVMISLMMGIAARIYMLKVDYRQYPTYPQAYLSHFTMGIIAAGLGAVIIPAILLKEYIAVTFLALAAQHFRDIRNMERNSLDNIEPTEMVPRGTAYIEDIAKAFEARNYMAILTAIGTGATFFSGKYLNIPFKYNLLLGIVFGAAFILFLKKILKTQVIGDIAEVKGAKIHFDGPILTINGIRVMNIGLQASRKIYYEKGVAVEIIPKDANGIAILSNIGQRQAIQHNTAIQLGIRKDIDEPEFTPLARRNSENGNVVMAMVVMSPSVECLIEAVKRTPVLESSKRKPLDSNVGKKQKKFTDI